MPPLARKERPLLLWGLLLFAVAAPWSIAAAQTAVVLGALILVAGALAGWAPWGGALWGGRPSAARAFQGGSSKSGGVAREARRALVGWPLPITLGLILLFLAIQAISIPFSIDPPHALRSLTGSWVLLFPILFWCWLARTRHRAWALRCLAASGGLAGLYGVIQHFAGHNWIKGGELEALIGGGGYIAVGSLGHHLSYAGVLLPILFVALGLALGRRRAWLWWGVVLCILGGLGFSYARTAWVGLAAGLLVLGLCRGRRALVGILVGLAAMVALAAVIEPAIGRRLLSVWSIGETPRTRLWLTSLRIIADHPWIGGGLGSFKALFAQYRVAGEYMSTAHPHSDLLNVLVETGIPGGLAWIAIWVAFFWETRPRGARPQAPGALAWMPDALRAAVAALLVAGLGQCFSTDEKVAQVWYFLIAGALQLTAWGPSGRKLGDLSGAPVERRSREPDATPGTRSSPPVDVGIALRGSELGEESVGG